MKEGIKYGGLRKREEDDAELLRERWSTDKMKVKDDG